MPGGYSHLCKMAITKCAIILTLSSLVTSPELATTWSPGQNESTELYVQTMLRISREPRQNPEARTGHFWMGSLGNCPGMAGLYPTNLCINMDPFPWGVWGLPVRRVSPKDFQERGALVIKAIHYAVTRKDFSQGGGFKGRCSAWLFPRFWVFGWCFPVFTARSGLTQCSAHWLLLPGNLRKGLESRSV